MKNEGDLHRSRPVHRQEGRGAFLPRPSGNEREDRPLSLHRGLRGARSGAHEFPREVAEVIEGTNRGLKSSKQE